MKWRQGECKCGKANANAARRMERGRQRRPGSGRACIVGRAMVCKIVNCISVQKRNNWDTEACNAATVQAALLIKQCELIFGDAFYPRCIWLPPRLLTSASKFSHSASSHRHHHDESSSPQQ
jgi:hypothetical protein